VSCTLASCANNAKRYTQATTHLSLSLKERYHFITSDVGEEDTGRSDKIIVLKKVIKFVLGGQERLLKQRSTHSSGSLMKRTQKSNKKERKKAGIICFCFKRIFSSLFSQNESAMSYSGATTTNTHNSKRSFFRPVL
jgi:hypothetical protein